MGRWTAVVFLLVVGVLAAAAPSLAAAFAGITISSTGVTPVAYTVTLGQDVAWLNTTSATQTVTVGGATLVIAAGQSKAWHPTAAGSYAYKVTSASTPPKNLHGTVAVQAATATPTPKPSVKPTPTPTPRPSPTPTPRPTATAGASAASSPGTGATAAASASSTAGPPSGGLADASGSPSPVASGPDGSVASAGGSSGADGSEPASGGMDVVTTGLVLVLLALVVALSVALYRSRRGTPPAAG